jgi:hypothetical protein
MWMLSYERSRRRRLSARTGRTITPPVTIHFRAADRAPHDFLEVLDQEPHLRNLRAAFDHLARRLGAAVPDLGRDAAGDSTALSARPKADPQAATAARSARGTISSGPRTPRRLGGRTGCPRSSRPWRMSRAVESATLRRSSMP